MLRKIVIFVSIVLCCFFAGCGRASTAASPEDTSSVQLQDEVLVTDNEDLQSSADVSSDENASPDEAEMVRYAEDRIAELTGDEKYKNASDDEQYTLTNDLLTSLEKDGYIKNVYYAEKDKLFSFQYANGVFGGVYLDSFAVKDGEIPMN